MNEKVNTLYKKAAGGILDKVKVALGLEEPGYAPDAKTTMATGAATLAGALVGRRVGEGVLARRIWSSPEAHSRALDDMINERMAARKLRSQRVGGAVGGLVAAAGAYALTNPRARKYIAGKLG